MEQLPAFLAAVLGPAFTYELNLLVFYVLLLNVRRSLWRAIEH